MRIFLWGFLLSLIFILPLWGQQPIKITDGVNGTGAINPAATQPRVSATSQVVSLSPNNGAIPVNLLAAVQNTSNVTATTATSLAKAFVSNVTAGNTIIVSFCNGNANLATTPVSDGTNTYTKAVFTANSTTFECGIFYAVNVAAGATTVTITPGGTTASIAMEIYEYSGLVQMVNSQADVTSSNVSTAGTATGFAPAIASFATNSVVVAAVGLGTASQTITPVSGWVNDSGQQNPATPTGMFSFISMSYQGEAWQPVLPSATFTSEPWAVVAAIFRSPMLPINGTVRLASGDPCQSNPKSYLSFSQTANTQVLAGTASRKIYPCSFHVVTATAQNVALIEGTGSTCATNPVGVVGFGGATAATGWNFAANGGIAYGDGSNSLGAESVAGDNVCLFQSGSGQLSGGMSYVVQ